MGLRRPTIGPAVRGESVIWSAYEDHVGGFPNNGPTPVIIDTRFGAFPLLMITVATSVMIGSQGTNPLSEIDGNIASDAMRDI